MIKGLLSLPKLFGQQGFLAIESGTGDGEISSIFSAHAYDLLGEPGKVVLVLSGTGEGVLKVSISSMKRGYLGIESGLVCMSIGGQEVGS